MIPIFIPFLNRPDLLKRAVDSVPLNPERWQVEVVNNSGLPLPEDICAADCNPPVPLTFAQSQNWMLSMAAAQQEPFYLFMHSDTEAAGDTVLRLVAMAQAFTTQNRRWGVIWTAYDALCAFNTDAMRAIGGWDTMLSWYCADNDTYRRLRLAGYETIDSNLPVRHEPSQTRLSDPEIDRRVSLELPFRESYYRAKWGGLPGREIFTKPFNI